MFFEADNSFSVSIDKNKIEEYANYENPYLNNWKIHDAVTGLPKTIDRSYFVFPDEIDMFYEGGKIVNSGHPVLSETPVHVYPLNLSDIEVLKPWVDPEDKNGNALNLPNIGSQIDENDPEDQSDAVEPNEEEYCETNYLKFLSALATILFIILTVFIVMLI